jgi:hypothetical protein
VERYENARAANGSLIVTLPDAPPEFTGPAPKMAAGLNGPAFEAKD